ncbi:MAG: hypothetical protein IJ400_05650 [Clostridia bacterium]|nr:hypothetical protein [Clostridia bacterium]
MKLKKLLILACALLLVVCVFASCDGTENPPIETGSGNGTGSSTGSGNGEQKPEDTQIIYTITIVDANGNPIKDVNLQICDGGSCLKPKVTGDDGKATYTFDTKLGEPGVQINEAPEGFKIPSGYIYFEANEVNITITLEQVKTYTVNAPCGAVVELFNGQDESCAKATVDETGIVTFEIAPDSYYAVLTHVNGAFTLANPTDSANASVIVFGESDTITATYNESTEDIQYKVTVTDMNGGVSVGISVYTEEYSMIMSAGSDENGVALMDLPNGTYYVVAEVESTQSATVVMFQKNGEDEGEIKVTNAPSGSMKSNAKFIPGEAYTTIEAGQSVWFYVVNPESYNLSVVMGFDCTVTIDGNACDTANPIDLGSEDKAYIKVTNSSSEAMEFMVQLAPKAN